MLRKLLFVALLFPAVSYSQPIVDITLVDLGTGVLEIRLKPSADFDGFFAASVFTIRWLDASEAVLGYPVTTLPAGAHYVATSGEMVIDNGYRYQVYAGFGNVPLYDIGTSWTGGQEFVLCTIAAPTDGTQFSIVIDDWVIAHNGVYYISLNGTNSTGEIYSISTDVADQSVDAGFSIAPNPSGDLAWIQIPEFNTAPMNVTMFDATGRAVLEFRPNLAGGTTRFSIDLCNYSVGNYMLRLQQGERILQDRLVIAR